MAYPSTSFKLSSPMLGFPVIDDVSTVQKLALGTKARFRDDTYGEIACLYMKGVASVAKGDVCAYDAKTASCVRAVAAGATSVGPVAVAMGAVVAASYGWFAVEGSVPVASAGVAANKVAYLSATAGTIDDAGTDGEQIEGMEIMEADAGGFTTVCLSAPVISENA
jgi:hypothetical protein